MWKHRKKNGFGRRGRSPSTSTANLHLAMRRRNYAHLELKALRSHLDEHANQDRNYGNSDWIAEEKASSADEKI